MASRKDDLTQEEINELLKDVPRKTFRQRLRLPKRLNKQTQAQSDAPYVSMPGDPAYHKIDRGNSIKVLTNPNQGSIIKPVKQAKRKDDKMATDIKPKNKVSYALKSVAWLIFATQQAYVGYLALARFHGYIAVAAGLASLGIAIAVVIAHFFSAHK